jgi:hypothetical protein
MRRRGTSLLRARLLARFAILRPNRRQSTMLRNSCRVSALSRKQPSMRLVTRSVSGLWCGTPLRPRLCQAERHRRVARPCRVPAHARSSSWKCSSLLLNGGYPGLPHKVSPASRLRQAFVGSRMKEFSSDIFCRVTEPRKHLLGHRRAVGAGEGKRLRQGIA